MMQILPEIKNLEAKDMRQLKFEATTMGFDPKSAPIQASIQFGLVKDV